MSKFRVAFNVDLSQIAPDAGVSAEAAADAVRALLLKEARANARNELHSIRLDPELDHEVRVIKMAEQMRKLMLTLMAEANLEIDPLSEETPIETELPFEKEYRAAA